MKINRTYRIYDWGSPDGLLRQKFTTQYAAFKFLKKQLNPYVHTYKDISDFQFSIILNSSIKKFKNKLKEKRILYV